MEKRWQNAHFLMNMECNNISNINELRYAEDAGQEICDITHKLLVRGKDVIRVMGLPITRCAMSLTCCWS